jgi:hypothetical protein
MILKHFNEGDLVKYFRAEYFAMEDDQIGSHVDEKIGMFIDFWNGDQFDACRIYIFSDKKISTVSSEDLSLLSKNEK